ncbi:uncharacterized protein tdrd12 isoform X4 [Xyrichtys novacula]|uniref:RNA helicase n=1 Tax=Xyrichtys novacula TaxID=13765 RepID=A0AAV1F3N3_XYRNO|nr:uncharacterized protein tdrd12 isoform X4 [Xyrichtys novacula]
MLTISVLKVENPSCLWGRVIRGPSADTETAEQYNSLLLQMNLFYHDITQDRRRLTVTALEEGQVCVVYWPIMKSWCRAVVESIIIDSVSCHALCLLVDYGERFVVPSDQIRVAVDDFLQLPFWLRRFHLARIKPATLRVSVCDKAEIIPSSHWDSSATLYLHNLLKGSTRTEAVLLESESDSTSIELYLTVGNIKICVNDDLVMKKFAFYIRASADSSCQDEVYQFPVLLPSSVLNPLSTPRASCTAAQRPTASPVMSQGVDVDGTGDRRAPVSTAQSQQEPMTREAVGEQQLFPGSQSESSTDAATVDRFLKILKFPSSSYEQAAPSVSQQEEDADCEPEETTAASSSCSGHQVNSADTASWKHGAADLCESHQDESPPDEGTGLLEWLNPQPLNFDPYSSGDEIPEVPEIPEVVPNSPAQSGILVHSAFPVEPCSDLDDAPVTNTLRRVLRRKRNISLSAADRHSWPAVAHGFNTVIISSNADQPLSYLPPLLGHLLRSSIFTSLTSSTGPLAVLLCPGWEKVQAVYDLLEEIKVTQTLHPVVVLLGVGEDEAKTVKIPKNCLLLVTTPFSLVRLLACHCFLFLRLYHLILDEADQLFTLAPDQMATVLQHFQKVTTNTQKGSCPQQLVATAKRWTNHMEGLLANHMPHPCVVITIPEEAALYGNVQQVILTTLESSKIFVLLSVLDFNPDVGQKTLIVVNSAQEVEDVFKAVTSKSALCLRTHEGLTHMFDFVIQQWRKNIGPGTHVILVTTTGCLKGLQIRDATCVVHYSFPASPKVFGSRLFCMVENFRNLSERAEQIKSSVPGVKVSSLNQSESSPPLTRSVLLISERNARHVVGALRYLVRTNALLPPELLTFAQGFHVAREDQKTSRPFCRYIKSFGVCRDGGSCPDRHRFIPQLDQSVLPASGVIEVIPLYIKTASVFYGCIIKKEEGGFQSLVSEMTSYYAEEKPRATELQEGGLYAVEEDQMFLRVKILSVPERGGRLFFSVLARFIDVGKEEEVKSHQILQLPERFHSLPGQAVEIIVCRVKPVDEETSWHPKVTRAISLKIRGVQHRARAVFSLGNSVFVDPMVRVTQVPGMKTVINEYNVQSEILKTGMGVSNPEHLNLLKALCQETKTEGSKDGGHMSGSRDGPGSLEVRIKAEEDVLAEAFRAAEVRWLSEPPPLEPCEPLSPPDPLIQSFVPEPEPNLGPVCDQRPLIAPQAAVEEINSFTPDLQSAEQLMRIRDGQELPLTVSHAAPVNTGGPDTDSGTSSQQVVTANETNCDESSKSFHPQVRWYQTSNSVIVTVKLTNPETERCDFHPDRVVYRCTCCDSC